ncbi:hypothetical protein DL96DRAFT_553639 [Flagelloscypha sp. PMI_526]|nr:hypothetical protein DL96DRAFT_553639 [Flagelloscypha sp. PMI_526]
MPFGRCETTTLYHRFFDRWKIQKSRHFVFPTFQLGKKSQKTSSVAFYNILPTISRLHTLIINDVWNIPFIKVVSHCQFLRSIELDAFSSVVEDPDDEIDPNALPNVHSFIIVLRGDTDLAPYSSIGRFFEEKGSSIESLSLGTYRWEDMPFSMDLVPGVKQTLRQLTLVWPITQHLKDQDPLQLSEFPSLETLHFTICLNTVPRTLFLQYLYRQFEQARFHSSLRDVYIEVVAESAESLSPDDSETTSMGNGNMERLAICSQVSLHVTLHIERYSVEDGIVMKSEINVEEYDSLQRAMEECLWWWVGAGQLVVTRQYEPLW